MLNRSRYTIHFDNKNYINAILNYNKFSTIYELNGKAVDNILMEKLENILAIQEKYHAEMSLILGQTFKNDFTISIDKIDSYSTIGIFPKFKPEEVLKLIDVTHIDNLDNIVDSMLSHAEFVQDMQNKDKKMKLPSLKMEEAYFLLTKFNDRCAIDGAMHLAANMQIIFQLAGTDNNYVLRYGEKSSFRKMGDFSLDIDDGFIYKNKKENVDSPILARLQDYFEDWKQTNYEGPLIPATEAKFVCDSSALITNLRSGGQLFDQFYDPNLTVKASFKRQAETLKKMGCAWVDGPIEIINATNEYGDVYYAIQPKSAIKEQKKSTEELERDKMISTQHDIVKAKLIASFSAAGFFKPVHKVEKCIQAENPISKNPSHS